MPSFSTIWHFLLFSYLLSEWSSLGVASASSRWGTWTMSVFGLPPLATSDQLKQGFNRL
ncbi:unnamed protein product [Protopolystoma xenopodis]|uniref:J domain-containing protein n=1 Tax=Protopolystoma xenopodis TaxID=117903 RepID=A0A3S5B0L5_9PLAT|nr:unnamed protein product [Protopolystoma xenopodis]